MNHGGVRRAEHGGDDERGGADGARDVAPVGGGEGVVEEAEKLRVQVTKEKQEEGGLPGVYSVRVQPAKSAPAEEREHWLPS